ncbi:cytochrome P450 [Rhizobium laguerreae]|nr:MULTISPECIES: cytochrome P450 [Rhizobium]MBY3081037.1 cytochrome P450 [Rhizobium laguerreae]MBY3088326.1 cytochrome P450 [Rhizobium laguerreae]MBY3114937.1 cytochrome P450 [Rhizobium laguerreae]MBY3149307.1 cytochrome P450 [Rhizobium laguerreae]MBY3252675.1 cytochrome P450 [Rhizobium laguerreae]
MTKTTMMPSVTPPTLRFADLNIQPHDTFATYRPSLPFVRREDGAYLVLRASDVQALAKDPRTKQVETQLLAARGISGGPIMDLFSNSMLFSNDETHRRRRQPLAKCFSFRMMEGIRRDVRLLAEDLASRRLDGDKLRLRDDYASAIPSITLAGILGIDSSDVPLFTSIAYRVSKILTTSWTDEDVPSIEVAARELEAYCSDLIADRRRSPKDDFISEYVASVDQDANLSAMEAIMQLVSIVIGGTDTTRAAIVIQTGLLLERADLWEALRKDENLIVPAVAEALRVEPAVASIPRLVVRDIELDQHFIASGSVLLLSTMSALRDPEAFPDPERFDLYRERPRWHPVYGDGPHRCLGQALAQLELEEALRALVGSRHRLLPTGQQLNVHGHAGIRQVDELEARWT